MNFFLLQSFTGMRQAWDLGPSAAMLVPGHTPPQVTKHKKIHRLKITVCCAVRANSGQKIQR